MYYLYTQLHGPLTEDVLLPRATMERYIYGMRLQENAILDIMGTMGRSTRWHGLPMEAISLLRVLIRLYRSGVLYKAVKATPASSHIRVIRVICVPWPGQLTVHVLLLGETIRPYKSGMQKM